MVFLITNIVLLVIILFLFMLLSWFWPPDSPWSPWWRTNKKIARAVCRLAGIKKNETVYELGSGDAQLLIVSAKEFGARGIGIEIDPLRFLVSSILLHSNGLSDRVKILRKNFYDVNLSKADMIYVYLVPRVLKKLLPKFKKELKKGTRIVSYVYEIDLPLKKFDKENNLRLYII